MILRFTNHGEERKYARQIGLDEIKKCIRCGEVENKGGLTREYSYKGIHVIAELIIGGHLIITCFIRLTDRKPWLLNDPKYRKKYLSKQKEKSELIKQ